MCASDGTVHSALPKTSERLLGPDAVPYFVWDTGMTFTKPRDLQTSY